MTQRLPRPPMTLATLAWITVNMAGLCTFAEGLHFLAKGKPLFLAQSGTLPALGLLVAGLALMAWAGAGIYRQRLLQHIAAEDAADKP